MPLGKLGCGRDNVAAGARAHGEDRAAIVARADEHVLRPRRAMHEVPGLQVPLLTFDGQLV